MTLQSVLLSLVAVVVHAAGVLDAILSGALGGFFFPAASNKLINIEKQLKKIVHK